MTEIVIFGSRYAGKTTYLATLAACPHKQMFSGLEVTPIGPDAENLIGMAEDILKKGASLPPNRPGQEPIYQLEIKLPSSKKIDLVAQDYAGEIFENIALDHKWSEVKAYVYKLFRVQRWLIMITDWRSEQDTRLYKPVFSKLWQEITAHEKINPEIKQLRIAVVMAKCERGEIWPGRLEPDEDLFKVRLPETYQLLKNKFSAQKLRFFACSSFGVKGEKNPRPNRVLPYEGSSIENAFLMDESVWQPYGLIAPIYWLSTGKKLRDESL